MTRRPIHEVFTLTRVVVSQRNDDSAGTKGLL